MKPKPKEKPAFIFVKNLSQRTKTMFKTAVASHNHSISEVIEALIVLYLRDADVVEPIIKEISIHKQLMGKVNGKPKRNS